MVRLESVLERPHGIDAISNATRAPSVAASGHTTIQLSAAVAALELGRWARRHDLGVRVEVGAHGRHAVDEERLASSHRQIVGRAPRYKEAARRRGGDTSRRRGGDEDSVRGGDDDSMRGDENSR